MFKMATLVYKCLKTSHSSYFRPFFILCIIIYNHIHQPQSYTIEASWRFPRLFILQGLFYHSLLFAGCLCDIIMTIALPKNWRILQYSLQLLIFVYLGFYVAFNTVQVISRRVVGRAEETSTYSSLGFCTVNCRPTASNYQLSHLRP